MGGEGKGRGEWMGGREDVCGRRGECGEGSVDGRELIQFKNSNFHVSDSLQAISLVSPSPHHHCQLRTETVEIVR